MKLSLSRRQFLASSAVALGGGLAGCATDSGIGSRLLPKRLPFKISLAEWSLHRALFGRAGTKLDHMDFPVVARRDYGISGIELVNQFFKDKARDQAYLREFKKRCDGEGVAIVLIMIDDEGALGDPDSTKRRQAVINHHPWAEAAKYFGCHSIRVNAETEGVGSFEEQQNRAADGLSSLGEYCAKLGLNCIVENHGHLSSNGKWLSGVMGKINRPNCGILPDFGNFFLGDGKMYDRYLGVEEMMPFAKAVSAKSYDFDAAGNCIETDYVRMMKIVLKAGYHHWVGIEYEGEKLSEPEGIRATKTLLERLQKELA